MDVEQRDETDCCHGNESALVTLPTTDYGGRSFVTCFLFTSYQNSSNDCTCFTLISRSFFTLSYSIVNLRTQFKNASLPHALFYPVPTSSSLVAVLFLTMEERENPPSPDVFIAE